ncbi:unnamed protein product [Cylicocyclus nassatus]|uniref:Uncharacterized protein n=1 Tax=Cylicocyclus nassatus TaxID=53992 RepID=A0AA36DSJ7_CYLNA|nr:unnamed protein product [Cylicocyclus nassatus]
MLTSTAVGDIDNDITSGSPEMKVEPVIVTVPCDDEIICLDSDEGPSPPPKEAAINSRSTVSRLLLQVIRLHLSERCSSPACKDIRFQAQSLKKKVEEMESVATKLRRTCSAQQKEMTRLSSELAKSNRKLFEMEGVVTRQSNLIRVLEGQLNAIMSTDPRPSPSGHLNLQKPGGSSPLNGRSLNVTRKESPLVQRKTRSDANISHLNGAISPTVNGGRFYKDAGTHNNVGNLTGKKASKQPAILSSTSPTPSSHSLNVCNPRSGRISLEVPFVAGNLLQDFSSPIGTPVMDYPAECHHCKVGGPIALALVIKTEPLNFLLTKKVQGVVKYTAHNGCRPKNVKIYAYLESAVKVRRWASSLVHTFADADKIKFDIILSKDQQVAQYDRIVAFAFASTGMDKFVTSRVVFNIGYPPIMNNNRPVQPPASAQSPFVIEAMDTNATPPPVSRKFSSTCVDDSNFEVYRP